MTPNVLGGDIRFSNLSNGIISHNSNLYVSNTSFKNIILDNAYTPLLGNFNGCGISINGGYLSLKGLGGTYGSDICFENCNYGVVNNKGNCDVSLVASTPDNNTVIYLSDTKKATVTDNCIQGKQYGVFTYHNPDADILIDKNDFRMSTTKNSIACVRNDEFSLDNKIVISNNEYGTIGKYGKQKKILSLNFDDHVWIKKENDYNPYKTLPPVFENYSQETLDLLVKDLEDLADGGAAMTAYNYLQFSEIPFDQRQSIAEALLKYCELDTLAMAMLLQGWREKIIEKR